MPDQVLIVENDSQTFAIGVGCSSFHVFRVRVRVRVLYHTEEECCGILYQMTKKRPNLKLSLKENWLVGRQTVDYILLYFIICTYF